MEKENLDSEFIPYNPALRMKALGFNKPCLAFYLSSNSSLLIKVRKTRKNIVCLAPTWRQAFKWFRDEHELDHSIIKNNLTKKYRISDVLLNDEYVELGEDFEDKEYEKPEEAELALIEKLLDIVEAKIKEDESKTN